MAVFHESTFDCSKEVEIVGQDDLPEARHFGDIFEVLDNRVLILVVERISDVVDNEQRLLPCISTNFYLENDVEDKRTARSDQTGSLLRDN